MPFTHAFTGSNPVSRSPFEISNLWVVFIFDYDILLNINKRWIHKYKEFRMLIFSIIFFFVIGGVCVYFALDHNRSKVIIGVILSFVVLMMLTTKYNMKIFNDSMLVYEFKGIGILPALIDYKDVKEIKLVSKHKVKIKHKAINEHFISSIADVIL